MPSHGRVAYQPIFAVEAGNFNGATAGSTIPLNPVKMGLTSTPLLAMLCVVLTVDAETDGLQLLGRWQVSQDKSTWYDVAHGPQNAAPVAFATGTAGADAVISRAFAAPECVEAWNWVRFAFVTAGATGAAIDTYSAQYAARRLIFGGR
jgi:hypothetical protein